MPRYIMNCKPENVDLAAKAIKYGENEMPHKDAIIVYTVGSEKIQFYVKRTKSGFSVRECL